MRFFLRSQAMGMAALALGASVLLSRVLGLVRDKVISYHFGASLEADLYFTAFVVPDFLNYLLAGGYFSVTLVPLLAMYFTKNEADGWRFFSSAVCWAFLSIFVLTSIAWLYTPEIARFLVPKYSAEAQGRLAYFLRIILPAQICFLPGACFSAMLYYRKQFIVPALTPLLYNGCIILGGFFCFILFPEKGIEGFCWGVLVGAGVGSLALPAFAVFAGGSQFLPALRHKGMKRVLLLALPLMLGQSIVVLDEQFIRIFGGLTGEGGVSLLSYARRIMQVPVGVIAQAAGLASYPFLAALVAEKKVGEFNLKLNSALQTTVLVALPVSLWMMSAAEPIMRLIFQQGSFSVADASYSGMLLSCMMIAVLFWAAQQILGRAFYAHQDTLSPALTGTLATCAGLPLYYFGAQWFGAKGVALASSASVILYTVFLWWRWKKRHGAEATSNIARKSLIALLLSLPACAVSYITAVYSARLFAAGSLGGAFVAIISSGLVFLLLYFGVFLRYAPELCSPFTVFLKKIAGRIQRRR